MVLVILPMKMVDFIDVADDEEEEFMYRRDHPPYRSQFPLEARSKRFKRQMYPEKHRVTRPFSSYGSFVPEMALADSLRQERTPLLNPRTKHLRMRRLLEKEK